MSSLSRQLIRAFRRVAGAYQSRFDRGRRSRRFATLTCHFFQIQLPAPAISSLALGMIELRRKTRLVFAVSFAALPQSRLMTAVFAAVALAAITRAAEIKDDAAFWTSAHSLAYLDFWQRRRAFPKAGLDNRRQSWQAMDDWYGGALTGAVRLRPQPMATVGAFPFLRL
jgi:hypothetical protein